MPEFSMEVYANGVISGLRTVRPNWEIIDLKPQPIDRSPPALGDLGGKIPSDRIPAPDAKLIL